MNKTFLPAKMLLALVGKGGGRGVVDAAKRGGARGGTKLFVRTVDEEASSGSLVAYVPREVVLILMWDEAESVVAAVAAHAAENPEEAGGTAIVVDVSRTLVQGGFRRVSVENMPSGDEGNGMKSGFTMIVTITNLGEADALMAAARNVGARGGTVINARGTGTEDDLKYFGISLVPEKELLIIVSENSKTESILEALGDQPVFSEPGGGVMFTTDVARFITLGAPLA